MKERLEKQLSEISKILQDSYKSDPQIGVFSGISGISLFQFYYSKYLNSDSHSDLGVEIISESINRINEGYNYPTYCSGMAGAGWVLDHLEEEEFIEVDADGILSNLDEFLFNAMMVDVLNNNYDFLHGAIGYGYYFLKRFKNTKSKKLKIRYTGFLTKLVSSLEELSIKDANGIKWLSVVDKTTGVEGYNLSLSHGMSSIINFLSRLIGYSELEHKVRPLLKGAVSYILSYENNNKDACYLFPSWVSEPFEESPSRLSWCYGDLGLGISLRLAAIALQDDLLYAKSLEILEHSAHRKTTDHSFIKDAGICHGAYGNALIFERLYKETNNVFFKDTSVYWINEGLAMSKFDDGYAGYKQWNGAEMGWEKELGFLTGIAGIGLAMIFHLSDFEMGWDECLMIA